jgi:hypothetical protein
MGGGLLQLVAYGAQDAYLSGNPQITFWKGLFKRHTNFAMEPFRVNLTGQASWGTKSSAILGRHADLITSSYIEVELENADMVDGVLLEGEGLNLVNYVELDIGGQVIDRQYGEFMFLWSVLTLPYDKYILHNTLQRGTKTNDSCTATGRPSRKNVYYIPLMFFFCRNPGMALPLIALQYHEVKINILWNDAKMIYQTWKATTAGATAADYPGYVKPADAAFGAVKSKSVGPERANLLVDYVYLDVEERRRMAQESHEYLIEQTQFNEDKGITTAQNRIDLTFNHPVKELIWVTQASWKRNCRLSSPLNTTEEFGVSGTDYYENRKQISPLEFDDIIYDCSLQLNGQDRVPSLPGKYFRLVQPYQHHSSGVSSLGYDSEKDDIGLYMYSFAIKPEEHQPSGTCNFSRIDTATLVFSVDGSVAISETDLENYGIRVYAINYNILRVMSGMAGLAYSN